MVDIQKAAGETSEYLKVGHGRISTYSLWSSNINQRVPHFSLFSYTQFYLIVLLRHWNNAIACHSSTRAFMAILKTSSGNHHLTPANRESPRTKVKNVDFVCIKASEIPQLSSNPRKKGKAVWCWDMFTVFWLINYTLPALFGNSEKISNP